jgi:hypothetical protein
MKIPFHLYGGLLLAIICSEQALGGPTSNPAPCPTVVTMLVPQFKLGTPITGLPRVELRQCGAEEILQIVAWKEKSDVPSLIVDTTDFTTVQVAARDNVFLIETTGGPRDIVFVIVYKSGNPALALKSVTKGTATVKITQTDFEILISGIYAGDLPPRTESHIFKLALKDLYEKTQ